MGRRFTLGCLCWVSLLGTITEMRAYDGQPLWTNRYNSAGLTYNTDWPTGIAVDTNGDVVVTGYSHFNGVTLDYVTIKYSNQGIALWTNRYDNLGNDQAVAVATDPFRNVIVTGFSESSGTGDDFVTIKYSPTGVALWTNRFASPGNIVDRPVALAVNRNGTIFVTGYVSYNPAAEDYLTVGYSSAGLPLWTNQFNGPANRPDRANAIAVDGIGNVFVTGIADADQVLSRSTCITLKFSEKGIPLWTNRYGHGSDGGLAAGRAIAIDRIGNVLVAASSSDSAFDFATIKYSNEGQPLWTNRFNGSGNFHDTPAAIGADTNGNVFVTGSSISESTGNNFATIKYSSAGEPLWTNVYPQPGAPVDLKVDRHGDIVIAGSASAVDGYHDFFVLKYANSGILQWTNRYGAPAGFEDLITGLALDSNGNVFVTGPSLGTNIQGAYDYVTIKYAGPPPPTRLAFAVSNNRLVLSWTNAGFTLQSAPSLGGTFTNVPGATSPYTNTDTSAQKFFRLIAN